MSLNYKLAKMKLVCLGLANYVCGHALLHTETVTAH